MDTQLLIDMIAKSKKTTPVEVYIKGDLSAVDFTGVRFFGNKDFGTIIGEWEAVKKILSTNSGVISDTAIRSDRRNSAIPMLDTKDLNCRVEPGAYIRETVGLGNNCVIMMGAVVNLGAEIGDGTLLDMNCVIGGRVIIGKNCHIGAGAVLAGVIEPPSAMPVRIGDDLMIGANAVILEGVQVGNNAVIAAGSVVTADVPENAVAAGVPAKVIKMRDSRTDSKTAMVACLREL